MSNKHLQFYCNPPPILYDPVFYPLVLDISIIKTLKINTDCSKI